MKCYNTNHVYLTSTCFGQCSGFQNCVRIFGWISTSAQAKICKNCDQTQWGLVNELTQITWNTSCILPDTIFFFIDKHRKIILKEGSKKATRNIQEVYTRSPTTKNTRKHTLTNPQIEPNQSTKLIKERGSPSKQDLDQEKRLQTKEIFNLWIDKTSL